MQYVSQHGECSISVLTFHLLNQHKLMVKSINACQNLITNETITSMSCDQKCNQLLTQVEVLGGKRVFLFIRANLKLKLQNHVKIRAGNTTQQSKIVKLTVPWKPLSTRQLIPLQFFFIESYPIFYYGHCFIPVNSVLNK